MRAKMSDQLLERRKESLDTNEGGLKFGSIIKEELGIKEWWAKEGTHTIDILPYVAGKGNPERKIKEGDISDHATFYVHKNVGANDAAVICPAANYNKPCPICEYAKELREQGRDDEAKALRSKRVTLYNIICYDDNKEEDKGVQIWPIAHWNMERHLNVIAQKPRSGGKVLFSHPDDGKSVVFERKGTTKDNTQYLGHRFEERDYVIPDELLDQTYCLEEIVNILTYDEISEVFFGNKGKKVSEAVEEITEEKPRLRNRKPMAKAPEPEPEPEPEDDDPDVPECFGLETDKLDECSDCKFIDECTAQYEINENEKEPEPEPEKPTVRKRFRK